MTSRALPGPARRSGLGGPAAVPAATQVFVEDLTALELAPQDGHHLAEVLRLRKGETVIACDGAGSWRVCAYRSGSDSSRVLEADGPVWREPASEKSVVVGFAAVKGERPELVVQKLTEVGVDRIAIVRSERTIVRWEGGREARALERLRRVARQAASQSRRAWLPEVTGVVSLAELRDLLGPGVLALAEPGAEPLNPGTTSVAVGPEGGWDPSELQNADRLVGLGPQILRAETAAIAAGYLLCALRDGVVMPARQFDACNHHAE